MLINKSTKIIGKKVVLVPYRKEHVLKYHKWMESPELQTLTASEPLTLQEEYDMQNSWMVDANKCTFIILEKEKYESTQDEVESMIGDTNLFFLSEEDTSVAEAEIMIAENWARGKHYGLEAMLIMLYYGIVRLSVKHYVVKVSIHNNISLRMFANIGFIETSRNNIFQEVTLDKIVDASFSSWLENSVLPIQIVKEGELNE